MPRTFTSEEERQAALDALPETPPSGADVDQWQVEQTEARDEILSAEIVPEGAPQEPPPEPSPQETPVVQEPTQEPPAPAPPAPEPQQAPVGEGQVYFTLPDGTQVRQEDLPEELRGYADPREVLKQFGHARKYANVAETRLTELTTEFAKGQEDQRQLREELEALKKGGAAAVPPTALPVGMMQPSGYAQAPIQPPVAPGVPNEQVVAVDAMLAEIEGIEEDPLVDTDQQKKTKAILKTLGESVKSMYQENASLQTLVVQQKQDFSQQLDAVSGDSKAQKELLEKWKNEADSKTTAVTVTAEVRSLQGEHPELDTSKPVFSPDGNGGAVENAAWTFANKILTMKRGSGPRGWDEVNAVVNQFNGEDTELMAFCQNSGISPADAGITPDDLQGYATIVNAYNMVQGKQFNRFTGQLEQMRNPFGKPVNFPSIEAAYQYMLSQGGITKKRQEDALAQAELRGEQKLESAVQRAATSAKTIGSDGAAGPESAGGEMTAEQAEAELNRIDLAEMEKLGSAGDRQLWSRYAKAYFVSMGIKLPVPDHWPALPQQQGVPAV